MTLADRIVVLNGGVIEQVGAPMDLYEHPQTLFVAELIGSPKMNLVPAEVVDGSSLGATVRTSAGETLNVSVDAARAAPGDQVTLGVRPEHLALSGPGGTLGGQTRFVETLGAATFAYVGREGGETLTVQLPGDARPVVGETLGLHVPAHQAHLFDASGAAFRRLT
jgi:ABC-type sugar transport system ATPase subunit